MATPSPSEPSSAEKERQKMQLCVRRSGNFGAVKPYHLGDDPAFNTDVLRAELSVLSPKLVHLMDKIKELDAADLKKEKRLFKHMIFTDIESVRSIKLIAGALAAYGFQPCFNVAGRGLHLKSKEELKDHIDNVFGLLISKKYSERTMSVPFKKSMLALFNERPDNVYGKYIRIMALDNGYKEGIDLFDVKYVHLFDPQLPTDEKQSMGRSLRFCGQVGLNFKTGEGWPLHVFKYDMQITDAKTPLNGEFVADLWTNALELDIMRLNFAADLEAICINSAVDRELTSEMHNSLKIKHTPPTTLQKNIANKYPKLAYPKAKIENKCAEMNKLTNVSLTPTQQFLRDYFTPASPQKGVLVYHSIGSGKTCTAVAVATNNFQRAGYTIVFVTRTTLKADVWKNISGKIMCHELLKERIANGEIKAPSKPKASMSLAGAEWLPPLSYKQLTNMITGENKFYDELLKKNGSKDPLRKTLLIIDEAHKLYSGTSKKSEQPDMAELERLIQQSYKLSGTESVRVMLMSGTPIVNDGMELVKLMNLLRPAKEHLPASFSQFSNMYLDFSTGRFTKTGQSAILKAFDGYISYLNRGADIRYFARPILENVIIPMTRYSAVPTKALDNQIKALRDGVKASKASSRNCKAVAKESKSALMQHKKESNAKCMELKPKDRKVCKEGVVAEHEKGLVRIQSELEKCQTVVVEKDGKKLERSVVENAVLDLEEATELKKTLSARAKALRGVIKEWRGRYKAAKEDWVQAKKAVSKARAKISKKYKNLKPTKENKAAAKAERTALLQGPLMKEVHEREADKRHAYTKVAIKRQQLQSTNMEMGRRALPDMSPFKSIHESCYKIAVNPKTSKKSKKDGSKSPTSSASSTSSMSSYESSASSASSKKIKQGRRKRS